MGLSVDLYSPQFDELVDSLSARGLHPGYYEIFLAETTALGRLRSRMSEEVRLAYHAEGLWITQPDFAYAPLSRVALDRAASQTYALRSAWLNHECAIKHMSGYSFGTYLPPLYTEASANQTAENILFAQHYFDEQAYDSRQPGPLFLLEMPPLTYFFVGTIAVPDYFVRIARRVPCGFVLDVGHLWTVYRYTGAWRRQSLETFTEDFLDGFPMERVIEIHVAGLDRHQADRNHAAVSAARETSDLPRWVDAHGSPIPEVLFDMLDQVLGHPRLATLKGVALEVDTKPIGQIVTEFEQFVRRFGDVWATRWGAGATDESTASPQRPTPSDHAGHLLPDEKERLAQAYDRYAQVVIGQRRLDHEAAGGLAEWEATLLPLYTHIYLPHEILCWGGDIREMFPETCRALDRAEMALDAFVTHWFREPRPEAVVYDFFLLKIARFLKFISERLPSALPVADHEAEQLRIGYRDANQWDVSREVYR